MISGKYIIASVLVVSTSLSHAGGYIGASVGQSELEGEDSDSIAIVGGYKFNKNFAIEGSYINLYKFEENSNSFEADGINMSAIGIFPINETIEIFAKVGIFKWDATLKVAGFGEGSVDGSDISFGIGASLNITNRIGLVLEYQKFDLENGGGELNIKNMSLGARFNF